MLYKLGEKQILLDYIELERYEAEKEVAYNILKGVLSVEKTAKYCHRLSVGEIKKIQEEILQSSEQETLTD